VQPSRVGEPEKIVVGTGHRCTTSGLKRRTKPTAITHARTVEKTYAPKPSATHRTARCARETDGVEGSVRCCYRRDIRLPDLATPQTSAVRPITSAVVHFCKPKSRRARVHHARLHQHRIRIGALAGITLKLNAISSRPAWGM
jgi:hypothetical protein